MTKNAHDYYEECINDPDSVNHQAALVVACNLLEDKDAEISALEEGIRVLAEMIVERDQTIRKMISPTFG